MIELAGIVVGAVLAAGGMVVPAAAADQSAADAAVEAFTQRMLDAGFVTDDDDAGFVTDDDDVDGGDEVEVEVENDIDDDEAGTDDALDECFAESGIVVPDDPDAPMPGTTAEAESPSLEFRPSDEPVPTDTFDLSPAIPETIATMVTTVDESGVDLMSQLVGWMGSKTAAKCFEEAFAADVFDAGSGDDDGDDDFDVDIPPPEIDVSSLGDIGVGEQSARFDMSLSMTFIVEIELDVTMLIAHSDRSMVMVVHTTGADGMLSGVDPIAELQTVLDDLAA